MRKLLYIILFISFASFSQDSFERGMKKNENGDYYGAIADFNKVIEINPNDADGAYANRGMSKYALGDKNGACQDARKAQDLGFDATPLIKIACN